MVCLSYYTDAVSFILLAILEKVHKRETIVLEYWAIRKKKHDKCLQFVQFEASAKEVFSTYFQN